MKSLSIAILLGCLLLIAAAHGWAESKKDEVAALIKDLKTKNAKARISAAKELGHIGAINAADTKDAIPVLLDLLKKDRDAGVRQAVAAALGRMDPDPESAVPVFTERLKEDKNAGVRMAAATSLGQLGAEAKEAIPALREAQKDKDRGVSRAASMAIRNIEGTKKK